MRVVAESVVRSGMDMVWTSKTPWSNVACAMEVEEKMRRKKPWSSDIVNVLSGRCSDACIEYLGDFRWLREVGGVHVLARSSGDDEEEEKRKELSWWGVLHVLMSRGDSRMTVDMPCLSTRHRPNSSICKTHTAERHPKSKSGNL